MTALGDLQKTLPEEAEREHRTGQTQIVLDGTRYRITLWQGFVDSLFSPINQMESARSMLTKVNFPRESLILAGLLEVAFSFSIRFAFLFVGLLWFGVSLPWTMALAPLAIVILVVLGTTIGLALLPFSLLYQDVHRGLVIACSLWLFVTPVVYPPPTKWPWVLITYANPVTPFLVTASELITTGVLTRPMSFAVATVLVIPCFAGAWVLYRLAIPHMIARISS